MNIYATKYYKYYILIPLSLAIIALFLLPTIPRGVDITGGTSISVITPTNVNVTANQIKNALSGMNLKGLQISIAENPLNNQKMYMIEYSNVETQLNSTNLVAGIKDKLSTLLGVKPKDINVQEIGPAIGRTFWNSSIRALILAFIFMASVVFITFKELAPSTYVVSAAMLDVLYALMGMAIFRIPLSLATMAALLMLIGYSVDTDILLTTRVLKRRNGSLDERILGAMKTGVTMSGTTIGALSVMVVASWILHIQTLMFIGATLVFGLVGDLISTWLMNAVILKWWVERKT